jgi:hypothetical protein
MVKMPIVSYIVVPIEIIELSSDSQNSSVDELETNMHKTLEPKRKTSNQTPTSVKDSISVRSNASSKKRTKDLNRMSSSNGKTLKRYQKAAYKEKSPVALQETVKKPRNNVFSRFMLNSEDEEDQMSDEDKAPMSEVEDGYNSYSIVWIVDNQISINLLLLKSKTLIPTILI